MSSLEQLIETLKREGIEDKRVLEAFKIFPRELFIPGNMKDYAYENSPLPIGYSQTISQPFIVAYMTEKLAIEKDNKVLEIGTGSGFQTAILSYLAKEVYTVERIKELYESAKTKFEELDLKNVKIKLADGKEGWKENSPYERIIVTAAAKEMPPALLSQLKDEGIAIAPLGDYIQYLYIFKKKGNGIKKIRDIAVSFVPLL